MFRTRKSDDSARVFLKTAKRDGGKVDHYIEAFEDILSTIPGSYITSPSSLIEEILKQPVERRLSMWDIYSAWADGFREWDVGPTLATELIDNVSEHRRRPHGKCRELARRFGC